MRDAIVDEGVINLPFGEGRHAPIAAEDQARLIATILANPTAHIGRTYTLHGPRELTQHGIAEAISGVLGRTITYRPSTIETYRERLTEYGRSEFLVQHLCAVALDYQNGGRRQDNRRSHRPAR